MRRWDLRFAMILLTFLSNRFIVGPMEHDRALAGGQIEALMPGSPPARGLRGTSQMVDDG